MIAASLLDTGAGANSVNKDFLSCRWKESVILIKRPPLPTASREVVNAEAIMPLFVRIGVLCMRAWLKIVRNLATYILLGTSYIDL